MEPPLQVLLVQDREAAAVSDRSDQRRTIRLIDQIVTMAVVVSTGRAAFSCSTLDREIPGCRSGKCKTMFRMSSL